MNSIQSGSHAHCPHLAVAPQSTSCKMCDSIASEVVTSSKTLDSMRTNLTPTFSLWEPDDIMLSLNSECSSRVGLGEFGYSLQSEWILEICFPMLLTVI